MPEPYRSPDWALVPAKKPAFGLNTTDDDDIYIPIYKPVASNCCLLTSSRYIAMFVFMFNERPLAYVDNMGNYVDKLSSCGATSVNLCLMALVTVHSLRSGLQDFALIG